MWSREKELAIPNAPKIRQHAFGIAATRRSEWWMAWVIPCEVEQVLELGWTKVEAGKSIVTLGSTQ